MSMRHVLITATALVTAVVFVAAPAQAAEQKGSSTMQQAKTGVSDSWVTAKTKIALFGDDRVKGTQVKVETKKGVVILRGKVDSGEAKKAAGEIAKGIDGVRSVKNDLQVVPAGERKAVDTNDKEINGRVEDRLKRDPGLKSAKISARTDAGVVTLTGEVRDIMASARASELARAVPGVHTVKNELSVNPKMSGQRSDGGGRS